LIIIAAINFVELILKGFSINTLLELYKNHEGKISDKWEMYVRVYDRLFKNYFEKASLC
jgi:hypothetical protein